MIKSDELDIKSWIKAQHEKWIPKQWTDWKQISFSDAATQSAAGLMSAADKKKLDGMVKVLDKIGKRIEISDHHFQVYYTAEITDVPDGIYLCQFIIQQEIGVGLHSYPVVPLEVRKESISEGDSYTYILGRSPSFTLNQGSSDVESFWLEVNGSGEGPSGPVPYYWIELKGKMNDIDDSRDMSLTLIRIL